VKATASEGHSRDKTATSAAINHFSDDEILKLASNAKNGAKFRRLLAGDISDYPKYGKPGEFDHSVADAGYSSQLI